MALILGLPRLLSLCFAHLILKEEDYSFLEKISGTTFTVQKNLMESIMTESPELIQTLISNPELNKTVETLNQKWKEMVISIQNSQTEKILRDFKDCQKLLSQKTDLRKSYSHFVKWTEVLKENESSKL